MASNDMRRHLLGELESLRKQKDNAIATLHRLEGAEELARHLLARQQEMGAELAESNGDVPQERIPAG